MTAEGGLATGFPRVLRNDNVAHCWVELEELCAVRWSLLRFCRFCSLRCRHMLKQKQNSPSMDWSIAPNLQFAIILFISMARDSYRPTEPPPWPSRAMLKIRSTMQSLEASR